MEPLPSEAEGTVSALAGILSISPLTGSLHILCCCVEGCDSLTSGLTLQLSCFEYLKLTVWLSRIFILIKLIPCIDYFSNRDADLSYSFRQEVGGITSIFCRL